MLGMCSTTDPHAQLKQLSLKKNVELYQKAWNGWNEFGSSGFWFCMIERERSVGFGGGEGGESISI